MLTLNVFGPVDQTIENVTRDQMNDLLNEDQPNARIIICEDLYRHNITKLTIGSPEIGQAEIAIFEHTDITKHQFDNIPDAISAFRELTAHLFKA